MENVLIALDYDPTAQQVAEKGYELAKSMGARVTLLHVLSNEVYYYSRSYSPIMGFEGFVSGDSSEVSQNDYLKEAAYRFLEDTTTFLGNEEIVTLVKEGDFAEMILATADSIAADAIVIGSHSRRWLEKIVMGSVTEKVLKYTQIPLYIIPTRSVKAI